MRVIILNHNDWQIPEDSCGWGASATTEFGNGLADISRNDVVIGIGDGYADGPCGIFRGFGYGRTYGCGSGNGTGYGHGRE
jgi:hypothetical protein